MCDELSDAKCIATLDATVKAMSDKTRLSYELHFDGAASICTLLTDKECLDLLDTYRLELTDASRMKVLLGACATQAASAAEATKTSTASAPDDSSQPAEEPSALDTDTSVMTGDKVAKTTQGGEAAGHEAFLDPDETYTEEEVVEEEGIEEGTVSLSGGHGVNDYLVDQENAEIGQRNENTNLGGGLLVGQTVDGLGGDVAAPEDATQDGATCPMCNDLTDKDCLSALDAMVDTMSQADRFNFEKSFDGYLVTCASLDDLVCLEALDSARTSASDKGRLAMLKEACAATAGKEADTAAGTPQAPIEFEPAADPEPDHAGVPKNDSAEEKEEDSEAQEEAHEEHPEVGGSDDDDENTAKGGGNSGGVGQATEPAPLDAPAAEPTCEVCSGMTDKECLAALDGMVTDMDEIDRLAFEKSWDFGVCDSITLPEECLAELDQARMAASDKNRLTMLKSACAATPSGSSGSNSVQPADAASVSDTGASVPADQGGSEHEQGSIIEEPEKDEAGAEAGASDVAAPDVAVTDSPESAAPLVTVGNNAGAETEVPAIATIASTEEDTDTREWSLMMSQLSAAQAAKSATPTSPMSATSVGVTASALLVLGVAFAVVNRRLRRPVGDSAYADIDGEDSESDETEAMLPEV
uniref:Uncharacterized protein n=1 Tax=Florenciella parvula TaxID=236787 RepID=A0A7S2CJP1_9STRA